MDIQDFLSRDNTLVDLKAGDKARLIQDLSARAAASLELDAQAITQELTKREELGSTGMGQGIAIPHARLPGLDRSFGVFAKLKRPIDFQAIDGKPVDLVFVLLQPGTASGDLNALAAVARKLREPERLKRLRRAEDADSLYREITL